MFKKIIIFLIVYCFYLNVIFAVPLGQGKNDRFGFGHKDIQGNISTVTGGSALGTLTIRDTGTSILSFQDANDDVAIGVFQMQHDKKLSTNLDSIHVHYYLPNAPSAGNTVFFKTEYIWIARSGTVPALASWSVQYSTITFTGSEAQYSTGYKSVALNLTYPANEDYSSILIFKIIRDSAGVGSDTYASDLGVMYIDCHYISDKIGSYNETSD